LTTIASLLVTIGADISGLKRGLDDTETGINNLSSRLQSGLGNIGGSVVRTGAALTELTAPLRDFGAQGLQTASNFDSIMAEISARTGVVGEDLDSVRQFALKMGADTSFSAQQAGDAFLQLLSSGQNTEEAFATLPYILDAAAASGEDLGKTADTVTDIMASFGLPIQAITPQMQAMMDQMGVTDQMMTDWGNNAFETSPQLDALAKATGMTVDQIGEMYFKTEDAADVVNILAQAAGASSADMASLGQGFANVGGVAKAFGLSVEDTAAVLAILAENGIKGAESGTALKSMLLNMSRNTDEVKGMWSSLGLSMYDAMGNARPLENVIGDLDKVLDALPVEEQNEIMQTLAGTYGITALTALRGSISIDKMKDSMAKQATASEVAQARMDTFKGRTDSLVGSIETLAIEAMTPLMNDVLTPFIEQVTVVVNNITDWAQENPQLTNTIVAIGGALAFAGPLLVALGTAITLAAPAVGVLGVVLAALASPVALVGAALGAILSPIGLVIAGLTALDFVGRNIIDFSALGTNIQTGIDDALATTNLDENIKTFFDRVSGAFTEYKAGDLDFAGYVDAVSSSLVDAFSTLTFGDFDLGAKISEIFTKSLRKPEIDGSKFALKNADDVAPPNMLATFTDVANQVKDVAVGAFGAVFGIGLGVGKIIADALEIDIDTNVALPDLTSISDKAIRELTGAFEDALARNAGRIIPVMQLADDIKTSIETAISTVTGTMSIDLSGVQTTVEGAFQGLDFSGVEPIIDTHFNDILTTILGVVGIVFGGPVGIGLGIAKLVSVAIDNDFLGIGTLLENSGIAATVTDAFTNVKNTVDGIIQSIFGGGQQAAPIDLGATGFALQNFEGGGEETPLDRFVNKLRLGLDKIGELGTTVWDNIKPGLDAIGGGIQGFIANLSGADTSGLGDLFFNITSVIGGLVGAIATVVAQVGSDVIGGAMEAIGNALPTFGTAIANLISVFSDIGKGDWKQAGIDLGDTITNFVNAVGKLFGMDLQIPDFSTALDGFRTAFEAIPTILVFIQGEIERGVNNFASGIRGVFRDIEQTILDLQIKVADVQIALGINYDANVADKNAKQAALDTSNLAENLETGIATGLANSDINIDPAQYVNVDYAALADKITNPTLIQDALTQAMAEGDQAALNVLLPLATELGIDTQSLVDQFAASLTDASAAQIYNASLTADVIVFASRVDLGPLRGAINDAIAKGNLAGNLPQVPGAQLTPIHGAASGARVLSNGLVMAHQDELIVNRSQQSSVGRSGDSANITFNTNMSIDAMIAEMERRGYALPRGYAGEAAG
jgi:TP901 family phage tail tape measure protein